MGPSLWIGFLWFLAIGYMFLAQHRVCDAYFVPAINVFCDRVRKSELKGIQRWGEEAVAGATICALGCNGPELFANLISLYTGSDAGIGVVVGSEIFNLLVIIGCSTLAAPETPLQVDRVPFVRDVFFYGLSTALLYVALLDKAISWGECTGLLLAAALYVATVYLTTDIVNMLPGLAEYVDPERGSQPQQPCLASSASRMHGIDVEIEELVHSRMADGRAAGTWEPWTLDATEYGIYAAPAQELGEELPAGLRNAPSSGSIGFELGSPHAMLGPVLKYKDLKEVSVVAMGVVQLEFHHELQHVTLKLRVVDTRQRDELLSSIERYSLGRPWIHEYDATAVGAVKRYWHVTHSSDASLLERCFAVLEFPLDVVLRGTLFAVDVKDMRKEGRWPLCFLGAMFWLAVFSFLMLLIATQIHYNIPVLSESFLGITVCAIGTSFPNAVASVILAGQNKPAAAIANALGSNVQNVFLAMALPWVIYSAQHDFQPIAQNVAGIHEGILWMAGTLLLTLALALFPPRWALSRAQGVLLIALYAAWLALTSGEAFHWWPPLVN